MIIDCILQDFPSAVVDADGKTIQNYHNILSRDTLLVQPIKSTRRIFSQDTLDENLEFLIGVTCPAQGGLETPAEVFGRAFDIAYLVIIASFLNENSKVMNLCRDHAWNINEKFDVQNATEDTMMYGHALTGFVLNRAIQFVPDIPPVEGIRKDLYANDWENWAEGEDIAEEEDE